MKHFDVDAEFQAKAKSGLKINACPGCGELAVRCVDSIRPIGITFVAPQDWICSNMHCDVRTFRSRVREFPPHPESVASPVIRSDAGAEGKSERAKLTVRVKKIQPGQ